MDNYTVSGCIVTYNSKNIIERTISSLLEMTKGVSFKLYIVDNCSADGTAEYVEQRFPDVQVIRAERNRGFGAGHNLVIPWLDSRYHAVINPDIILESDVISVLARYMDTHPQTGLLSPKIVSEDGAEQLLGKRIPTLKYLAAHRRYREGDEPGRLMREYCMLDGDTDKPFPIQNATGCFMFFRTSEFLKLGGFDERFFMYLEDCDIARRVSLSSQALYYPGVSVKHLWERASKRNKRLLVIHLESIAKYFFKWGIR